MNRLSPLVFLAIWLAVGFPLQAAEITTAFTRINYADEQLLNTFNQKISTSAFGFGFARKSASNSQETAQKQVDQLVGRVQEILDMRPPGLKFTIELLPAPDDVRNTYMQLYQRRVDFIAFYSPRNETVYFAVNKLQRNVFAHEVAHAIIDRYFDKAPPVKIHELLAQYVEKQL
jgi:hypothetical protein